MKKKAKSYKDYCREAIKKEPKIYSSSFNEDGSLIPPPNMSSFYKKIKKNSPKNELTKFKKDGWKLEHEKPKLEITGTEIKTRGPKPDLTIWEMPDNPDRKEYKKVWIHNLRVRQYIKKLKDNNATPVQI